jgi:hypothetical protein
LRLPDDNFVCIPNMPLSVLHVLPITLSGHRMVQTISCHYAVLSIHVLSRIRLEVIHVPYLKSILGRLRVCVDQSQHSVSRTEQEEVCVCVAEFGKSLRCVSLVVAEGRTK